MSNYHKIYETYNRKIVNLYIPAFRMNSGNRKTFITFEYHGTINIRKIEIKFCVIPKYSGDSSCFCGNSSVFL